MSDEPTATPKPANDTPPRLLGVLAEFDGPQDLVAAARAIREKGYRKVEAYSPFPIHGIDEALASRRPVLPWVVLGAGLTGCVVAILMQWYMNGYESAIPFSGYQYNVSAKPFFSLPANIPVTFELIILFSAFTAFLGMIAFNKLPRLSNPLLRNERFLKATDDKFFLMVEADDPQFADDTIEPAMQSIGSNHVERLYDQPQEPMPGFILPVGGLLALVAVVPLVWVAMARGGTSETPRLSIWWDMDYQPKYKAQTTIDSTIFADGRAARLPVAGTVPRGGLKDNPALHRGYIPEDEQEETFETALLQEEGDADQPAEADESDEASDEAADNGNQEDGDAAEEETPADEDAEADSTDTETDDDQSSENDNGESADESTEADQAESDASDADATQAEGEEADEQAADAVPAEEVYPWVTEFPEEIEVSMRTMERGRNRFNIYCAVCHGLAGDGDGLVAQRAIELQEPTWRPPTSLHQANVVAQPVGKLYDTITNGNISGQNERGGVIRGGMAGYKEHISLEDRWAIVLYVKALQKTRNTHPDELREDELASIK